MLNGPLVTSSDEPDAIGAATGTSDPNISAGFYWLFSPLTGSHTFAATDSGYQSATASVNIKPDTVTRQDWSLVSTGGGNQ